MDQDVADKIATVSINHYKSLGKKGKPVPGKEWTLLSSIVMSLNSEHTVVAMATGTKCLGRHEMSSGGYLINDSHAEVLTRRCFLRYLYDQILTFKITGKSEIIIRCNKNNQYELNPDVNFHFYSSHVPCGDASIIPKRTIKRKHDCDINQSKSEEVAIKYKKEDNIKENATCYKHLGVNVNEINCNSQVDGEFQGVVMVDSDSWLGDIVDIHRTGAKSLDGGDKKLPGLLYHEVGAVRTKPGRGDPTLSVSCSDKLARWIVCGLQGALLSLLLSGPVMLSSVVVGGGGPYSTDVMRRALLTRSRSSHVVALLHSLIVFPSSRYISDTTAQPCPSAILWARVHHKPLEVCVEGRRQGATKSCPKQGRLAVCKLELLRMFLSTQTKNEYKNLSYRELKALAVEYNRSCHQFKCDLNGWPSKPSHLEDFKFS